MKIIRLISIALVTLCFSMSLAHAQTPVQKHGDLRISGKHIVNKNGAVTSLAGPSFFWSNTGWGQDRFYTRGAVETFARDWNAGIVRVAVGAQNNGSILKDRRGNLKRVIMAFMSLSIGIPTKPSATSKKPKPFSPISLNATARRQT